MDVTELTRTLLNTTQATAESAVLLVVTSLPAVDNSRAAGPSCNRLHAKHNLTVLKEQLESRRWKITFSGGPYQRGLRRLCGSLRFAGE